MPRVNNCFRGVGIVLALCLAAFHGLAWVDGTFSAPIYGSGCYGISPTPDGDYLFCGDAAMTLFTPGFPSAGLIKIGPQMEPNPTRDVRFKPAIDNIVVCMTVLSDGHILIGGLFGNVNHIKSPGLARLNPDGTLDTTFTNSLASGSTVTALALQSDGKILVGGEVKAFGQFGMGGVLRLNSNGSLDPSFSTDLGPSLLLNAIYVLPDGGLLVGGGDLSRNSTFVDHLVHLDASGRYDAVFRPQIDRQVDAIVGLQGGKILVGGSFQKVGTNSYSGLIRFNPDLSFDSDYHMDLADKFNFKLQLARGADGKIAVAGNFKTIGGHLSPSVAQLNPDGSLDTTFNLVAIPRASDGDGGDVTALAIEADGRIIVAGNYKSISGIPVEKVFRLNRDGSLDIRPYPKKWKSLGNGVFQFSLTNVPYTDVTIISSMNPSANEVDWTVVGPATVVSNRVFQITDPAAVTEPLKYYRVRAQ